jgi:purine-binding chemotaxis protein CheW
MNDVNKSDPKLMKSCLSELTQRRITEINERLAGAYIPDNISCWEIIQCGVEQQCEVFNQKAGRHCYLFDHTFCFGEDMDEFHAKIKTCVTGCPFYNMLHKEIGNTWILAHQQLSGIIAGEQIHITESEVLKNRADILSQFLANEETGEKLEMVIFQLGSDYFALDAHYIDEIRGLTEITPVPCTPDYILGICTIRGNVYSVLDIRNFFNAEDQPVTDTSMLIIVASRDFHACVLVDSVLERQSVAKTDVKHSTTGMKNIETGYVNGFIMYNQKIVTMINWEGFIFHSKLIINEEV